MSESIITRVESRIKRFGFSRYGFVGLKKPLSIEIYKQWLMDGYHGDMKYLEEHLPIKAHPEKQWPQARSAITVAVDYLPHPEPIEIPIKSARIAAYSRGQDYHFWLKQRLQDLADDLQTAFPNEAFIPITDSAPFLERDSAYQSGLGWVGKNTCLISSKHGSLFFLGELLTSMNLNPVAAIHPDRCGSCSRCIDSCPTDALIEPRKLDAKKCISYLTIESKSIPEPALRQSMQDWLFGCDICQIVCPWNEKVFGPALHSQQPNKTDLIEDLTWILKSSNKQVDKALRGSPLLRAGGRGLKRNALIVIANQKLTELQDEVRAYLDHEKLGELAHWTLDQLEKA